MSGTPTLITAKYEGVSFSFQPDGWFNATGAAAKYGKKPNDWLKLDETREYIAALNALSNASQNRIWHKAKRGNAGGTWLHPKLAVRFAQWLDVRFAVWCDQQIDHILRAPAGADDDGDELSTVKDRTGLYISTVYSVIRHRLGFGTVYKAFNDAAGTERFRHMTKGQVRKVEPIAQRIANGAATSSDWDLIERNRAAGAQQLPLLPTEPP